MIKPANTGALNEIVEKLGQAKFACCIKGGEEEPEDGEEAKEGEDTNKLIGLYMNEAFKALIENHNYPHVPLMGHYANFYELVVANYDWLHGGFGEGIVCVSPAEGPNCRVSKWKNGTEASGDNMGTINRIIMAMEDDKENTIFGENTDKAKDLFERMLAVEKSKLICGEPPKPKEEKKKGGKKEGGGKGKQAIEMTPEEFKQYEDAIKSAKTKFDHEDTFFAKNMKGVQEYAKLIADECLNDITVDAGDAAAVKKHNDYVTQMIKEDFIAYNRNKKGKK